MADEQMTLPCDGPAVREYVPERHPLEQAVYEALGAASVCWDDLSKAGVFKSDEAKAIGDALMEKITEHGTERWLEGYRFALTNLTDEGVLNDALTYLREKRESTEERT